MSLICITGEKVAVPDMEYGTDILAVAYPRNEKIRLQGRRDSFL